MSEQSLYKLNVGYKTAGSCVPIKIIQDVLVDIHNDKDLEKLRQIIISLSSKLPLFTVNPQLILSTLVVKKDFLVAERRPNGAYMHLTLNPVKATDDCMNSNLFPKLKNSTYSRPFDVPVPPKELSPLPSLNKDEADSNEDEGGFSNWELNEFKLMSQAMKDFVEKHESETLKYDTTLEVSKFNPTFSAIERELFDDFKDDTNHKRIFVVIGPSGSGKTTLVNKVATPDNTLTSFTTRQVRPGERDGIDYYFIHNRQVDEILNENEAFEYVEYNGYRYGYTKAEIIVKLTNHDTVFCIATIEGYQSLKSVFGDIVVPIYLKISKELLQEHLKLRDDTPENIQSRLALFDKESENLQFFKEEPNAKILNITDSLDDNVRNFKTLIDE